MNIDEQVRIIEAQLSNLDTLWEKVQWLSIGFDPDPAYSKEATDIVRGNLSKELEEADRAKAEEKL